MLKNITNSGTKETCVNFTVTTNFTKIGLQIKNKKSAQPFLNEQLVFLS